MSQFEVFAVVLSFILGLGVAQLLSSVVYVVHARNETALTWSPFLWAASIFLFHVNFLFAALWFYSEDQTFTWYLLDLLSAILLFLSGGLILPPESRSLPKEMRAFFEQDGRLALIPLALFLILSIPYNVQGGVPVFAADNLILVVLLFLLGTAFLARGRIRVVSTVGFAALTAFAFLFVWVRPGETPG